MPDQIPANWATDPTDPTGARRRYWDGTQWTDWVMLPGQEQPSQLSVADAQAAAAGAASVPGTTADAAPADAHMQSAPTERIDYTPVPDAQSIPYTTIPDSTLDQSGFMVPGPEPKKSRTGLILGIVGGVVALFIIGGVLVGIAANRAVNSFEDAAQDALDEWEEAADDFATTEPFATDDAVEDDSADESGDTADAPSGDIVSPEEVAAMSQDEYVAYAASVQTAMTADEWDGLFWLADDPTGEGVFLGLLDMFAVESLSDQEAVAIGIAACEGMTDETMGGADAFGEFMYDVLGDFGYDALEDYDALMAVSSAYVLCPEWTDVIMDMGVAQ